MISKNAISWNENYSNDGILYFAQRIVEMLDHKTIDIYRVPLLNSTRLINEYIIVNDSPAKKYNLEYIIDEFKDSFSSDIVLQSVWGDEYLAQIVSYINSKPNQRYNVMTYLKSTLEPNYLTWTIKLIRKLVSLPNQKSKIERVIRCFLPELFSKGYAREDVFTIAKDTFFTGPNNPDEALNSFLGYFNCKDKKFDCYVGIKKTLAVFDDLFKKELSLIYEDDGHFNELRVFDGYFVAAKKDIRAIDMTHAARKVYSEIDLYASFYQYFGDYSTNLLYNRVFVVDESSKGHFVNVNFRKFATEGNDDHPLTRDATSIFVDQLAKNSKCVLPELENLVRLHNSAITNNGIENGFLNFWSILEYICVRDHDSSKVEQVIEVLLPVLQYNYFFSIILDLNNNLKEVLEDDIYQQFLSEIDVGKYEYEKLFYLLLLPKFEPLLNAITDKLLNYPVLRSRMLNLHDNNKKNKDLFGITENYAERVRWHIYRIYRARNAITHSGAKPEHLKDLGEHLHTYVDTLLFDIIKRMAVDKFCSITSATTARELQFASISKKLTSKQEVDQESIGLFLYSRIK